MSFKIEKTRLSDFKLLSEKSRVGIVTPTAGAVRTFRSGKGQPILGWCSDEFVYGIVYQKVRRKTKVTKERNTQESACGSFYKRELVREAQWITTVYKFPIDRVKHFEQHKHHFDVTLY